MTHQASMQRYLMSLAAHFGAGGMMGVVFPWLITQVLHESQARVGVAQAIATLPMMFLILVGGAAADGRDLRSYLARLQMGTAIVIVGFALSVATGLLSFALATAFMFGISIFSAFIMPARDALLSHVVPPSLGLARAVAMTVAATFGGQLVGTGIGALASTTGAVPLLCLQAGLLAVSGIMTSRLYVDEARAFKVGTHTPWKQWVNATLEGFTVAWNHERLRTIILYLSLGAPLFNGWFLVGIPLMIRDVYQGSSAALALTMMTFLFGLTLSSFAFSRMPQTDRPGRLLMCLTLNNFLVFALVHFHLSYELFVALMFWWGITAGVAMALTRGMVQIAAPHAYRARVLSMLQFANVAGGPIGALMYGLLAQWYGILNAVLVVPITVTILWLSFRFFTSLWHFRHEEQVAAQPASAAPMLPD